MDQRVELEHFQCRRRIGRTPAACAAPQRAGRHRQHGAHLFAAAQQAVPAAPPAGRARGASGRRAARWVSASGQRPGRPTSFAFSSFIRRPRFAGGFCQPGVNLLELLSRCPARCCNIRSALRLRVAHQHCARDTSSPDSWSAILLQVGHPFLSFLAFSSCSRPRAWWVHCVHRTGGACLCAVHRDFLAGRQG